MIRLQICAGFLVILVLKISNITTSPLMHDDELSTQITSLFSMRSTCSRRIDRQSFFYLFIFLFLGLPHGFLTRKLNHNGDNASAAPNLLFCACVHFYFPWRDFLMRATSAMFLGLRCHVHLQASMNFRRYLVVFIKRLLCLCLRNVTLFWWHILVEPVVISLWLWFLQGIFVCRKVKSALIKYETKYTAQ